MASKKKKIEKYKILDLFLWWFDEKDEAKIKIETTKKGDEFFAKQKKLNPKFNEQKYLEKFFKEALTYYINADDTKTSD